MYIDFILKPTSNMSLISQVGALMKMSLIEPWLWSSGHVIFPFHKVMSSSLSKEQFIALPLPRITMTSYSVFVASYWFEKAASWSSSSNFLPMMAAKWMTANHHGKMKNASPATTPMDKSWNDSYFKLRQKNWELFWRIIDKIVHDIYCFW